LVIAVPLRSGRRASLAVVDAPSASFFHRQRIDGSSVPDVAVASPASERSWIVAMADGTRES
jgi:hypothetical protein